MSVQTNKELVRRFCEEAINRRDTGAVDRLLSEDFVHNGESRGRDGQRQAVQYFLTAFPDLRNEIELILGEGDLVAAHQRWRGTHGGEFLGVKATGKIVEFTSAAVLRISDGYMNKATLASKAVQVPGGPVTLLIRPKGKTKRKLNEKGKAKVKVSISYTPTGLSPNSQSLKLKLKKKRKKRKKT